MKDKIEAWLKLIEQIETKIADGQTKRSLRLALDQGLPDEKAEIIQLLARWSTNERQRLEGLINDADFKVENNHVTKSFLSFLSRTEEELKNSISKISTLDQPDGNSGFVLPDFTGKGVIAIVYAQDDQTAWEELKKHLFVFTRDPQIQFVDIHKDVPLGVTDTFSYQEKLINAADRVLGLVSPNIMAYPTFVLAEQALATTKLIPLLLEKVDLEDSPFQRKIRGLPADGRFVSEWSNRNSAFADIAKHLRPVFKKLKASLS